jgi:hypothetical protein
MLGYLRYVYAKRGVIAVATTYYLVLVTFLTAYVHPTRAVTVTIDDYNEAEVELAFMLLSLPAAAQFILDNLKKHPQETSAANKSKPPAIPGINNVAPTPAPSYSCLPATMNADFSDA